jgi:sec-independent protein translocase protein TatA
MPNLGATELLLLLGIVILIFGVGKLPQIGAGLGKSIRGFRQAVRETDGEADEAPEKTETGAAEP